MKSPPVQWMTTLPKPGTPATGWDAGQRGWRAHAVEADESERFSEIGDRRAACGLLPRHGWSMDLFIDRRCTRCERALGLPISEENKFSSQLRAEFRARRHQTEKRTC
jgi:hypothetical protein